MFAPIYNSIGGRRTGGGGGGGLERSLAMFLFFVIPAVSFLFACTFWLYNYMIDPTCTCTVQCLLEKMCACIWLPVNHSYL